MACGQRMHEFKLFGTNASIKTLFTRNLCEPLRLWAHCENDNAWMRECTSEWMLCHEPFAKRDASRRTRVLVLHLVGGLKPHRRRFSYQLRLSLRLCVKPKRPHRHSFFPWTLDVRHCTLKKPPRGGFSCLETQITTTLKYILNGWDYSLLDKL